MQTCVYGRQPTALDWLVERDFRCMDDHSQLILGSTTLCNNQKSSFININPHMFHASQMSQQEKNNKISKISKTIINQQGLLINQQGFHQPTMVSLSRISDVSSTNTGCWFQPLWKMWKSAGMIIPNIRNNKKNVPNHHPEPNFLVGCWFATTFHLWKPPDLKSSSTNLWFSHPPRSVLAPQCQCQGFSPASLLLHGAGGSQEAHPVLTHTFWSRPPLVWGRLGG